MKKLTFLLSVLIIVGPFPNPVFAQPEQRYTQSLFQSIQTSDNQIYATSQMLSSPYAGESVTYQADQTIDIFQPYDDSLNLRPVLICAHGGGFITGTKEHDDMIAFCDSFARKGYVTVSIDYRQGMNVLSNVSAERAVYRGLQDGRAAIRYIKENAALLRIDTNNVYFLGSSAGAFIVFQNIYMNKESERPASSYQISNFPPTLDNGPDLGALDEIQNSFKHGSNPKAVIALWGAVKDTALIESSDADVPVFLIHGMADVIVPFDVGSPFSIPTFSPTCGSLPISERLKNLGKPAETYFVNGAGHEFYGVSNGNWSPAPNAYWDTVLIKVTDFLHRQHKPIAKFSTSIVDNTVKFNSMCEDCTSLFWDFGDGTTGDEINPEHTYLSDGSYKVILTGINEIQSWDTVSTYITVFNTIVNDQNNNLPNRFCLYQNYPNPFNPITTVKFDISEEGKYLIKIFNVLGEVVKVLTDKEYSAGRYNITFDASNLSSGIYFYQLAGNGKNFIKKMMLVK
jgi:acetyl esterase/lipase